MEVLRCSNPYCDSPDVILYFRNYDAMQREYGLPKFDLIRISFVVSCNICCVQSETSIGGIKVDE